MKRLLALVVVLACVAAAPTAAAQSTVSVSGTVTVDGGSADGAQVTVVPVTATQQRAGPPARTTVQGSSFSVDVAEASAYAVRVAYGSTTHYEMLRNTTSASLSLSGSVGGRVADASGTPLSGVPIRVTDDQGFVVTETETDGDGRFRVGPVEETETYRVRATVDGVGYRATVEASESGTVSLVARPPTADASVLRIANDSRTPYVLQVVPPANGTSVPSVIGTITLRNPTDRPFVGVVELPVPADATPYAAMAGGQEAEYRRTDGGVQVNVSVPANATARVGVAADLDGTRVETAPLRDTASLTVVVQGYDPNTVDHSRNLRVGEAPIPLLTSDGPIDAGETIRFDLDGARTQNATGASVASGGNEAGAAAGGDTDRGATAETAPSASAAIPSFPGLSILGAVAGMVVVGLVGARLLPRDD
ncbi:carboxypeptidase-like regulatory domain-containing protein [Haloplanus natans]|uniref:carboxypeptidase-like regulatory domain-containing protein n=1 Tax=Haloplanus natans TaxID=376171 RepID=UPI000677F368|nr:carboxypeptidase-like regulatory domain-containing protein [Haloplanus natans]